MAADMQHPFQCLALSEPPGADHAYLLAACGAKLVSVSLGEDATVFEWSSVAGAGEAQTGSPEPDNRPARKQKTTNPPSAGANIIKLTMSPSHQHVVLVTEDKIVRVLEIGSDGTLNELSQRAMPKRPCAIDVLPDNATILCGDKFGDVYSLPLLPEAMSENAGVTLSAEAESSEKQAPAFKPSASNTTVHTQRNRKALEAQLKQKNLTPKTKEPLKFEHKLLLGHVSMLTDLVYATQHMDGADRLFILTADRDEHIRVSRGPPQSHIIEGYCLGHTEYINKICLVSDENLLVSGGGDSWIGVWNWPSFELERKIEILDTLKGNLINWTGHGDAAPPTVDNINVSGIWIVPVTLAPGVIAKRPPEPAVVVALENVPIMLICPVADLLEDDAKFQAFPLSQGPLIDVTSVGRTAIASFDDRHSGTHRVQSLHLTDDMTSTKGTSVSFNGVSHEHAMSTINKLGGPVMDAKALDGLLYGVANMRKRGYQNEEGGDEADDASGH